MVLSGHGSQLRVRRFNKARDTGAGLQDDGPSRRIDTVMRVNQFITSLD
jgi:hypothetical protein